MKERNWAQLQVGKRKLTAEEPGWGWGSGWKIAKGETSGVRGFLAKLTYRILTEDRPR